jgi:hypothetical protein
MKYSIATIILTVIIPVSMSCALKAQNATPSRQNTVGKLATKGFIGTFVSVDTQTSRVSIASGAPAKADLDAPSVFYLTSETKFFKGDKPAKLEDAIKGQEVRYGVRINPKEKKRLLTFLQLAPALESEK